MPSSIMTDYYLNNGIQPAPSQIDSTTGLPYANPDFFALINPTATQNPNTITLPDGTQATFIDNNSSYGSAHDPSLVSAQEASVIATLQQNPLGLGVSTPQPDPYVEHTPDTVSVPPAAVPAEDLAPAPAETEEPVATPAAA